MSPRLLVLLVAAAAASGCLANAPEPVASAGDAAFDPSARASAPPGPAPGAGDGDREEDRTVCVLSRGESCAIRCGIGSFITVETVPGSTAFARCGHAEAYCQDDCETTSLLPALDATRGYCTLFDGEHAQCTVS